MRASTHVPTNVPSTPWPNTARLRAVGGGSGVWTLPGFRVMADPEGKRIPHRWQNPPGSYGGRKVLSRAFRNRFVQMQMDEIPTPVRARA